jgi:hypothetical protein
MSFSQPLKCVAFGKEYIMLGLGIATSNIGKQQK